MTRQHPSQNVDSTRVLETLIGHRRRIVIVIALWEEEQRSRKDRQSVCKCSSGPSTNTPRSLSFSKKKAR